MILFLSLPFREKKAKKKERKKKKAATLTIGAMNFTARRHKFAGKDAVMLFGEGR